MVRFAALLLILAEAFAYCVLPVAAQKKAGTKNFIKIKTQIKTKSSLGKRRIPKSNQESKNGKKVISAGIINSKAINLVKPEYPFSARSTGVYGHVTVQVLINEEGKVEKAESLSGNPLLCAVSVQAALSSVFEPLRLNDQFVRVRGIIVYNFLPESFNWEEVGFILGTQKSNNYNSFYTLENLTKCFPIGFDDEKDLVIIALNNRENNSSTIQNVVAMIEGKLSSNPKELWLFSLGSALANVSLRPNNNGDSLQKTSESLRLIVQTAPKNISKTLILELERLAFILENIKKDNYNLMEESESQQLLNSLLKRMPIPVNQ